VGAVTWSYEAVARALDDRIPLEVRTIPQTRTGTGTGTGTRTTGAQTDTDSLQQPSQKAPALR